ncbi:MULTISPECIES: transcriptional regulator NrdR [Congzhengia]|jgi:transcriptional repressor NrdR|uniref:Transcriptional repressor NrdR n=1 Tax=Congzhengia minquanensis TaxID=2763657 RepID=A0A926DNG8_9FIRM|nr:transcriptional regulator NrdR [Congzhengia minquanensis]MBC8540375.1 transcriptional regulator NrdR [Congzhengia minquanensis]
MKCPFCEFEESKVIDSRPTDEGEAIRRRRECLKCGKRFTTYEKIENIPLMVIKKDGSRQMFDRQKLLNGIMRACEKRPVKTSDMEHIVTEIEAATQNLLEREISSQKIGEMVMERLPKIDEVAYVRFASVYRQFKDINTFVEEVNKLLKR